MQDPYSNKKIPGPVLHQYQKGNHYFFESDDCTLRISVIGTKILRFFYLPDFCLERDFSYAVLPNIYDIPAIEFFEDDSEYCIQTYDLKCRISREDIKIILEDTRGHVILEDDKGFHWEDYQDYGGHLVYCSKKIQLAEVFLGLGDKPTDPDLRGRVVCNWGSDMYGFEKDRDPLYKNIPFFMGLHHGRGYGVFMDNTYKTTFDFGHYNNKIFSFWADGGPMNYYFIYGPELISVSQEYVKLTGVPELPPMWALGYHQSKWSYFPANRVRELATQFRSLEIPCDALYLDIDYMDSFKCFTWHEERFPNPQGLMNDLKMDGFHTVVILDPGIKIDREYEVYKEGVAHQYFCKRGDGPLMKGTVWPGDCHFPDFTNPEVRQWWTTLLEKLLKTGVAGIWNDMNEPAVFGTQTFPLDVRHHYDGEECSHRKAHNVYGMQMARASYEGCKEYHPDKRPFLLTRSGYSGVQRYSAVWTGDNLSTWEHIWIANIQCQRLSISGLSFCGSDIGGFIGEPNGELFTRWIQLAVFHPLFRGHSSGDNGDKEPWSFGEPFTSIIRKYIEFRYILLPYIYTSFWQYTTAGTPMIRPLILLDQENMHTYYRKEEFQFGDHLFTCPVAAPGVESRILFLPKGKWYNYYSEDLYEGNREIITYCPLEIMPLFVRAGAVIPHYPVMQYTSQFSIQELELHVYFGESPCESVLYEDNGEGYDYLKGNYTVKKFFTYTFNKIFSIEQNQQGHYPLSYARYRVFVHGLPFDPAIVKTDMGKLEFSIENKVLKFSAQRDFAKINIG